MLETPRVIESGLTAKTDDADKRLSSIERWPEADTSDFADRS